MVPGQEVEESHDAAAVSYDAADNPNSGGLLAGCRPCRATSAGGEEEFDPSNSRNVYPQAGADDAEGYMILEDDDDEKDAEQLVRDLTAMKETVSGLRMLVNMLLLVVFALVVSILVYVYTLLPEDLQEDALRWVLLGSIPVVAMLFTWFHIWLAIQMMFRPLRFIGLFQCPRGSGCGLGWQGIVPRKAHKMASSAYTNARPYLDGPREWLARVDSRDLVQQVRPQLKRLIKEALSNVGRAHMPQANKVAGNVKLDETIAEAATSNIQASSPKLWADFTNLMCDEQVGVDNDGMIVKVFTENKELLNQFFLSLGAREFRFIEHCGAAMGGLCGIVQLIAFNHLDPLGRAIFLPVTGFLLGIVSNWLAIFMVFKPCNPVPIRCCGVTLFEIQGLFLKRQQDVAVLYSKLLCEHFLSFNKVINYLQTQPVLWGRLKETYAAHNTRVLSQTMGVFATWVAPLALGQDEYKRIEEDLKIALVKGLARSAEIHKIGGKYIGKVTNIEKNNRKALQRMPPNEFESLLHPVFQEDEWILILLGGILGAIVGFGQVLFLKV